MNDERPVSLPLVAPVPRVACAHCGALLGGAICTTNAMCPKVGDFTVCVVCRALMVFTAGLQLRWLTTDDLMQMTREEIAEVVSAMRIAKAWKVRQNENDQIADEQPAKELN